MKYGLIYGLVLVIFSLVNILTTPVDPTSAPWRSFLVNILILVVTYFIIHFGVKEFRDTVNNGALSLGEAIKFAILVTLLGAIIESVFGLIYFQFIDPEYLDRVFEGTRESLERRGLSEDQIDQQMKIGKMFSNPFLMVPLGIIYRVFWGLIKGLIAGLILKNETVPFPAEERAAEESA